jgi:hypothetical protein
VSETERTPADTPEKKPSTATTQLVEGWYAKGRTLDKSYVPSQWSVDETQSTTAGAARFYRDVIGSSCRTCHTALGSSFDWNAIGPLAIKSRAETHVCGGTADLANNASMPNALVSRDRVAERVKADPALAALMQKFLGCAAPNADPAYARR